MKLLLLGLAACFLSVFIAVWMMGLWCTPEMVRWSRSLPYALGFPTFVIGGLLAVIIPATVPVLAFFWFVGGGKS